MRRFALAVLFITMCLVHVRVHAEVTAPLAKSKARVEHVVFSTDDGALIYADVYGNGDRGLVLGHGGQFTKESWKPQAEQFARAGFHVLAFDFRGFGPSHGPGDFDLDTAPMHLDVLAAVRFLRKEGAKKVAVIGASFGGAAAADASIASSPGEIDRLILLGADGNGPAEKIKAPLLEIIARDDANDDGPRLPGIRAWFVKVPKPKKLVILDGAAHAQFLFQTSQAGRVMNEMLRFLRSGTK